MSECVVRIEFPESCRDCKTFLCMDRIKVEERTERHKIIYKNAVDKTKPDDCPFICSLPKEHGPLVDISPLDVIAFRDKDNSFYAGVLSVFERIDKLPIIVPAELPKEDS